MKRGQTWKVVIKGVAGLLLTVLQCLETDESHNSEEGAVSLSAELLHELVDFIREKKLQSLALSGQM